MKNLLLSFLRLYRIRYWFVYLRYLFLKSGMQFAAVGSDVGEKTIDHNLSAFNLPRAVFGCGGRMGLLIYPIVAYFTRDPEKRKVLVVGCRTEDDIYWLRAYRFYDTYGLDLFSYSKNILLGDIHHTDIPDATYDVVLLAWMISYSKNPLAVLTECNRILKPGGLLGIGIEHDPNQATDDSPRVNTLNTTANLIALTKYVMPSRVIFEYDHHLPNERGSVVVLRKNDL